MQDIANRRQRTVIARRPKADEAISKNRLLRYAHNDNLYLVLFSVFCFLFSASNTYASESVRIAIIQDSSSLSFKIKGFFQIKDLKNNKIIYHAKSIDTTVTTYKNGIVIGGVKPASEELLIESDDPEFFFFF